MLQKNTYLEDSGMEGVEGFPTLRPERPPSPRLVLTSVPATGSFWPGPWTGLRPSRRQAVLSSRDRQSPPGMKPAGSEVCALSLLPSTSKAHFKLHKIAEDAGDAENIPGGQVVPEGVVRCLQCGMIKNIKGTFMLQQMRSCVLAGLSGGTGGIWGSRVDTPQEDGCQGGCLQQHPRHHLSPASS